MTDLDPTSQIVYIFLHFYTALYFNRASIYVYFSRNLFVFAPNDDRKQPKYVARTNTK
jgi:hypothetical protein